MRRTSSVVAVGAVVLALAFSGPAAAAPTTAATAPGIRASVRAVALPASNATRLAAEVRASRAASPHRWTTVAYAKWYALRKLHQRGWSAHQMQCLVPMWNKESEWRYRAASGPYLGIPQTTAGEIRSFGYTVKDFRSTPEVQVVVGLRYIKATYGTPCGAWSFWRKHGWY